MRIGSIYGFHLSRLVDTSPLQPVLTALRGILGSIDDEVSSLSARRDETGDDEERFGIDSWIEDQAVSYHELLGIAFIAAQVEITRAVAEVRTVRNLAERKSMTLSTTSDRKKDIVRYGFPDPANPSPVQVIDAAANFQKHSDEWPTDWEANPPRNKGAVETVEVLLALGIKPRDFVIDACARHLGIDKPADLLRLQDILATWRLGLARAYKAELVSMNAHPADGVP